MYDVCMYVCMYVCVYMFMSDTLHTPAKVRRTSSWCKCVAVCCSVLQCVAVYLRMQVPDVHIRGVGVLQCIAVCIAVCCSVLQGVAVYLQMQVPDVQAHGIGVLQCVAVCCSVLQCAYGCRLPTYKFVV